jgi:hypothetical protein
MWYATAICLAVSVLASSPMAAQTASIEGSVHVVLGNGGVQRFDGAWVHLVPEDRIPVQEISALCATADSLVAESVSLYTALEYNQEQALFTNRALWRFRDAAIAGAYRRAAVDSTRASVDGRYALAAVQPGSYVVFAHERFRHHGKSYDVGDWSIYTWIEPLTVRGSARMTVDLTVKELDGLTAINGLCDEPSGSEGDS